MNEINSSTTSTSKTTRKNRIITASIHLNILRDTLREEDVHVISPVKAARLKRAITVLEDEVSPVVSELAAERQRQNNAEELKNASGRSPL